MGRWKWMVSALSRVRRDVERAAADRQREMLEPSVQKESRSTMTGERRKFCRT
jgi:hypothetical protein